MSPLEKFTQMDVQPRLKTFHTFGCPVYTLNRSLQSGKSIPKWDPRCYVGLYLGTSPRHARSISLALNLQSRHISPQFHVKHDEFFETIDSRDQTIVKWKRVVAKSPKIRPRTKHINLVYHHFREHVRTRLIQLFPISTTSQVADIYTKPLSRDLFTKFRKQIMGW